VVVIFNIVNKPSILLYEKNFVNKRKEKVIRMSLNNSNSIASAMRQVLDNDPLVVSINEDFIFGKSNEDFNIVDKVYFN